jgi:hypothetical protein
VIAPFWTDLFQVQICTKTAGTKLTIQWTGLTFDGETPVQFQVILDGSNDSIEFVYGPDHLRDHLECVALDGERDHVIVVVVLATEAAPRAWEIAIAGGDLNGRSLALTARLIRTCSAR